MSRAAPVLIAGRARPLSNADAPITFTTTGDESWPVWDRFIAIRGASVFEIGNICPTCEFWFRRLEADAEPIDIEAVQRELTDGLEGVHGAAVDAFGALLQSGRYRLALFSVVPVRVAPGGAGDYFINEQRRDWPEFGHEPPNDPGTPYYRLVERSGVALDAAGNRGFEFVVPLQPWQSLDPARIGFFENRLRQGARPTAVAVGVLDIKQYYDSATAHWCLSHFLLDGHHKVEAAARLGKALTLLSFIACDHGISSAEDVDALLGHYAREPGSQPTS